MEIIEMNKALKKVMEEMEKLNPTESTAVLCMMIDYVAIKNGMESMELLNMITPLIEQVNNDMGRMEI